jgi:hypothetical protein
LEKSCKTVTNCSIAELLATFCDNILKKGGSEKLSDEAIEDTLKKVAIQASILYYYQLHITGVG